MHALIAKVILPALCALTLPGPASANEDDLRYALKRGASTTLATDISAHESALGRVMTGYGHVNLYGNGLFLSTKARPNMARAWAVFHMTDYNGDTRGASRRILLGYDLPVMNRSRLGFVLGIGKADLDTGGEEIDSSTLSLGPHLKTRLGKYLRLRTWATLSRPAYRFSGHRVRATRVGAGMRAGIDRTFELVKLSGSASFGYSHQRVPGTGRLRGFEITRANTSLTTRATFYPQNNWRPYLDFGLSRGMWRNDDGSDAYSTPSMAAGLLWNYKKRSISVSVDGRQVFDPAMPLKLTTNYRLTF